MLALQLYQTEKGDHQKAPSFLCSNSPQFQLKNKQRNPNQQQTITITTLSKAIQLYCNRYKHKYIYHLQIKPHPTIVDQHENFVHIPKFRNLNVYRNLSNFQQKKNKKNKNKKKE